MTAVAETKSQWGVSSNSWCASEKALELQYKWTILDSGIGIPDLRTWAWDLWASWNRRLIEEGSVWVSDLSLGMDSEALDSVVFISHNDPKQT